VFHRLGKSVFQKKVLLSLREFAVATGLSLRTITSLVATHQLKGIRVGRRRLITIRELGQFVRHNHPIHKRKASVARSAHGKAALRKEVGR
jgi:excisionase family DNA binding protein